MSKNQFTGTATQQQCNRKFCQFNNDQYCTSVRILEVLLVLYNANVFLFKYLSFWMSRLSLYKKNIIRLFSENRK